MIDINYYSAFVFNIAMIALPNLMNLFLYNEYIFNKI